MKPPYLNQQEGANNRIPNSKLSRVLEISRLSQLPERKSRVLFGIEEGKPVSEFQLLPTRQPIAVCATCAATISRSDDFSQAVGVCRKCLIIHAKVEAALIEHAKRKSREWLQKSGGIAA